MLPLPIDWFCFFFASSCLLNTRSFIDYVLSEQKWLHIILAYNDWLLCASKKKTLYDHFRYKFTNHFDSSATRQTWARKWEQWKKNSDDGQNFYLEYFKNRLTSTRWNHFIHIVANRQNHVIAVCRFDSFLCWFFFCLIISNFFFCSSLF